MAQIILNIPDAVLTRVLDGISGIHGRPAVVDDGVGNMISNPETKSQFAKRLLKEWIKSRVVAWEGKQAGESAKTIARNQAISDVDIT